MAYPPIEDYGVIGDLHTVALVGKDGKESGRSIRGESGGGLAATFMGRAYPRRETEVTAQRGVGYGLL